MAKCFERWTVLRHDPIEKLTDNLWRVEGVMPDGKTRRAMSVARLADGGLVVHNAIALDDGEMAELAAFGTVAYVVVPNAYHRQDARIWKERFPGAKVLAPRGAAKKVADIVPVDGSYEDGPRDERVRLEHLAGTKDNEGVLVVRSADGTTVVMNDCLLNMPPLGGLFGLLLAPTGRPSVPRVARWLLVKDKGAFRAHVERLATPDLRRVIVGHGRTITLEPADTVRAALATLD